MRPETRSLPEAGIEVPLGFQPPMVADVLALDVGGDAEPGAFAGFRAEIGPWMIEGTVVLIDNVPGFGRLTISPMGELPKSGITTATLRGIRLGALLDQIVGGVDNVAALDRLGLLPVMRPGRSEKLQARADEAIGKRQTGRPPLPDDHYREVAERFLAEIRLGGNRGARGRLAEHYGRPPETVRDWIRGARARGYLSPAVQGRGGAIPGQRLIDERGQQ